MSDTQATDVETPTDATAEPIAGGTSGDTTDQVTEVPEPSPSVDASQGDDTTETDAPAEASDAAADSDEAAAEDDGKADKADKGDKKSRVRMLEREGEVAADFLETLLDIADLDGDIDVDVDGDRAAIAIVDSDEGRVPRRLVGTDGKVLEALQELTRLAVQVETGERSRLMLDIAGHRAQRRSALVELAKVAIAEVQESGTKRTLEPMTAFERKVVHDEVAAAGLVSESEGVDPHRHIVILPA
ncbi:R3H domain-containing nucleic acid-binding protein [Terracoccus sp. 273MFTsu3.1]|uniref:Jag family protein n=1 Tax=Terracoccus sp. 273MFTsu3.1 TaxID=1172188 RepID=UPI00036E14B3|nr:R3H domain-containing nucleic acid-binding protein [Terracoccus sp. 273MFTsu3.1]